MCWEEEQYISKVWGYTMLATLYFFLSCCFAIAISANTNRPLLILPSGEALERIINDQVKQLASSQNAPCTTPPVLA